MNALVFVASVVVGANLWFLFEYLLHRFATHELHGKGIMSREHLEHHVHAGWSFSYTHLLSWAGVGLVGAAVWFPVGWLVAGPAAAWGVALGWPIGYAFYEYEHAVSHLRPPRSSYQRWVRKNHFHHHFGKPMANHGVSVGWWDVVFGTQERPERVRVPRRFADGLDGCSTSAASCAPSSRRTTSWSDRSTAPSARSRSTGPRPSPASPPTTDRSTPNPHRSPNRRPSHRRRPAGTPFHRSGRILRTGARSVPILRESWSEPARR